MNCGITYYKRYSISYEKWLEISKYCSRKCMQAINPGAKSVIGKAPWNKGTKGICQPNSGSITKGQRRGRETEFINGQTSNDKNVNWRGELAGYTALHSWVKRRKPLTGRCEWCQSLRYTEMANLDYEYTRDLETWAELCAPCHKSYDRQNGWGKATEKFGLHNV